jgi:hypothetical protein
MQMVGGAMTTEQTGVAAGAFDEALDQAVRLLDEPAAHPAEKPAAGGIGRVDDRFKTRRVVTRSKNAWVLEAEHVVTGRGVALKVAFPNETSRARIRAEAKALGALAHVEGVVSILDARVDGETASYVALEWLRGRSLEGILAARASLPVPAVMGLGSVLADTLAEVHASGHVHGDLAPKHVFLTQGRRGKETVKLIDFGTSLLVPDAKRAADPWTAPEVVGKARTPASDVFALGAVLARILLGHPPTSAAELPKTPLGALLARALAPDPTTRPSSPDFLAELVRLRMEPEARMQTPAPAPVAKKPEAPPQSVQNAPASQLAPQTQASPRPAAPPAAARPQPPPMPAPVAVLEAPKGQELRKKPRASYVTPVRVTRGATALDGRSEDVSESGMLLVMREACTAGEKIGLRFALPMDGLVASCQARVAWSRSHAGMPGMHAVGVELIDAPEAITGAIAKYMRLMGVEG